MRSSQLTLPDEPMWPAMSLRRLIAEGRFPAPLKLGQQLRLWDIVEISDLIDKLKAERDQQETETTAAPGTIPVTDAARSSNITVNTNIAKERIPP